MLDWTLKELEYTLQIDILTNLPTKKHDRVLCLEISELVSNLGLSKDTTSILVEMAADFIALDKISAPTMEPSKKLLAHLQKRYLDLDIECNSTHYITILISYFSRGKQADLSSIVEIMFKRIQCMLTSEVYSKKIMANTLSTLINVSGLHMFVDHSFAEDIIGGILLKVQSISDEIDSEIVDLKLLAVGLLNNLVQDNIPLAKHLCSLGISNCCLQIKCKCISKKRLPKKTKLSVDTILFPHILVNLINDGLSGHDQADFNGQTLFTCILLTNLISIQPHLILSIKSALTGSSFDNVIDVLEQYLAFRDMVGSMEGLEDFAAKDDKAVRIVRKLLKFLHEI